MAYIDPTIARLYSRRRRSMKTAFDTAFGAQEQQAGAQIQALGGQYDALRGQAYTGARVSALGNNEALAAQGLAGNAYAGPQSGYSETSRSNQDIALGNALNAITLQQQGAVNDINTGIATGRMQNAANWLQQESALQGEEAQAQQQAYQLALQKAQNEVSMFGKVMTQEAARVLGVPVGTRMRGAGGGGGGGKQKQQGLTSDQLAKLIQDTINKQNQADQAAYAKDLQRRTAADRAKARNDAAAGANQRQQQGYGYHV